MNQRDFIEGLGDEFLDFWDHWTSLPKKSLIPQLRDYLDSAKPAVQPHIVIMDLASPSDINIRLAGTAVVNTVGEITNSDADELYVQAVKTRALKQAWTAASHPCGYTVLRTYKTVSGLQDTGRALLLPIEITSDRKSVVIYNGTPTFGGVKLQSDSVQTVIDYRELEWIDIGAGTPG